MKHAPIVEKDCVEWIGQREFTERPSLRIEDLGDAARNIAAIDQQDADPIYAVPMDALGCRQARLAAASFDTELMHLQMPSGRLSGIG